MFHRLNRHAPLVLAILRIVSGLLFLAHGSQKLLGIPPGSRPAPEIGSLLWVAGSLELVLGALIAIGLFTRPAAFVAAGEMAAAYWMFHAPQNLYPLNNGGEAAILFCFIFLYLVFAGPGAPSFDHRARRRGPARRRG
jgi:putative oxidoreductase